MADQDIINSGRDDKGQFVSKQIIQQAAQRMLAKANADTQLANTQVEKLTSAYKALKGQFTSSFQAQSKGWQAAQKQFAKSMKAQQKSASAFYKQVERMRAHDYKLQQKLQKSQLSEIRRLSREQVRAARQRGRAVGGRAPSGGGLGIGGLGLGSLIGGLSLGLIARKFMSASTPLLDAEINARGAAFKIERAAIDFGVAPSKAASLVTQYQDLGAAQFFGAGENQIKGLTRLQGAIAKGAGTDRATEMVLSIAKSFGNSTDRLNAFLQDAATQDVAAVLKQYASGQNIVQVTRALNALTIAQDKGTGKLPSLVEANLAVQNSLDTLGAKVEQLIAEFTSRFLPEIVKLTDALAGLDLKNVLLTAGGIYAGGKLAPALLRGGGTLAGGIATAAGAGGAAALGATATAGASLAFLGHQGYKMAQNRTNETVGGRLADWVAGYKGGNKDFGMDPAAARLRQQYLARRAEKEKQQEQPKQKSFWLSVNDNAQAALAAIRQYATKAQEAAAQDKVTRLQEQAKRQQQSQLDVDVASAQRDLRRSEMELARLSPFGQEFGMMSAIPEFNRLQDSITTELQKLGALLSTIDESSEQGAIEGARVRKQIIDLRKEQKSNALEMTGALSKGYLDAIGQMALGAGKFQRFLVTQERNAGRGLRGGLVKDNALLGSLNSAEAFRSPFRFTSDMQKNVSGANEYLNRLSDRMSTQYPALMTKLPQLVQDARGGAALAPSQEHSPAATPVAIARNKVEQLREIRKGIDGLIAIEQADAGRSPIPNRQGVG